MKEKIRMLLPRRIKSHVILTGKLQGKKIYTSWYDYPSAILGKTERPLLNWFEINVNEGDTWLDIGAHFGYTAIALCEFVGKSGRVIAFEPMVSTAGYITQTRSVNGYDHLYVFPFALDESIELSLDQLPTTRGMIDSTIGKKEWNETFIKTSLDWLWHQISQDNQKIHGVKIDVQGMEINVLKGMVNILKEQKPKLVVEVHRGVDRDELLKIIADCGYDTNAVSIETTNIPNNILLDDKSYYFKRLP